MCYSDNYYNLKSCSLTNKNHMTDWEILDAVNKAKHSGRMNKSNISVKCTRDKPTGEKTDIKQKEETNFKEIPCKLYNIMGVLIEETDKEKITLDILNFLNSKENIIKSKYAAVMFLMKVCKDLRVPGHQKKILVKCFFKLIVKESCCNQSEQSDLINWMESEADLLIHYFFTSDPTSFSRSSFWKNIGKCCRNMCKHYTPHT